MIEFDEHVRQRPGIDLTPMLDVVFLLLIFFLLTSAFSRPMLPLNLPEAKSAEMSNEPPVAISIKIDGSIYVNNQSVAANELYDVLSKMYHGSHRKDLNLMSDKGVPFGKVVEVLDIAKQSGAENIAVVTEKRP